MFATSLLRYAITGKLHFCFWPTAFTHKADNSVSDDCAIFFVRLILAEKYTFYIAWKT